MLLEPIEKSPYLILKEEENKTWKFFRESVLPKDTNVPYHYEIVTPRGKVVTTVEFPLNKNEVRDIVQFYKTGCYVKVDQDHTSQSSNKKCYKHLFFDNNGLLRLSLTDAVVETFYNDEVSVYSKGHYGVDVHSDGLNVKYKSHDGSQDVEQLFSYQELERLSTLKEDVFFRLTQSAPQRQ